jgi:hypothetical protein
MLSKCANPGCFANFRYLHEGRVFRLERTDPRHDTVGEHARSVEYFWLCERCSRSLKPVYEYGCVTVHPIHLQLPPSSLELETMAVPLSA